MRAICENYILEIIPYNTTASRVTTTILVYIPHKLHNLYKSIWTMSRLNLEY